MLEVWETRSSGEKSLTGWLRANQLEMHCTEDNAIRMIGGFRALTVKLD